MTSQTTTTSSSSTYPIRYIRQRCVGIDLLKRGWYGLKNERCKGCIDDCTRWWCHHDADDVGSRLKINGSDSNILRECWGRYFFCASTLRVWSTSQHEHEHVDWCSFYQDKILRTKSPLVFLYDRKTLFYWGSMFEIVWVFFVGGQFHFLCTRLSTSTRCDMSRQNKYWSIEYRNGSSKKVSSHYPLLSFGNAKEGFLKTDARALQVLSRTYIL